MRLHHHIFLSILTAIAFLLAQALLEYSLACLLALNFTSVMIWFAETENVNLFIETSLVFSVILIMLSGWFAGKYGRTGK